MFSSLEDETRHLVNFKRAWKRTLQKATIYYWSLDDKFSKLINEDDLDAIGYDEVSYVYQHLQKKAKAKKMNLPVGLMDIHIHDIRRTFGSYQAITGASLQIIGKSLGHKSPQ